MNLKVRGLTGTWGGWRHRNARIWGKKGRFCKNLAKTGGAAPGSAAHETVEYLSKIACMLGSDGFTVCLCVLSGVWHVSGVVNNCSFCDWCSFDLSDSICVIVFTILISDRSCAVFVLNKLPPVPSTQCIGFSIQLWLEIVLPVAEAWLLHRHKS